MKNTLRLSLVVACTALLAACGGGAKLKPGKDSAAAAAFQSSQGASGASGGLLDLARQNAGGQVDITVDCPKGGKATIHYVFDSNNISGDLTFNLGYAACSYDGKTSMDGTMAVTMSLDLTNATASLGLKGKVSFSGEISDYVDADVTETLSANGLKTAEGGSVTLTLNGTISTSTNSYSYSNETYTVTAGNLPADKS